MLMRCMALMLLAAAAGACAPSRDGEILWEFQIKKSHVQWGAVDAGRLYLCADDVYCLDIATGSLVWEFKTFGTHASAPVADAGRLYFQCGGLYALDAATGRVLWEFWTNEWAADAPAAGAGKVYAQAGGVLYCLDAANGKRLWSLKTGALESAPVVHAGRVFFCHDRAVFCLDAESGQELWHCEIGSGRGQLACSRGYLVSAGRGGLVRAHRITTGEVQWQLATDFPLVHFSVTGDGSVLISAGALYCVNPETGNPLWTFNPGRLFVRDAYALEGQILARTFGNEFLLLGGADGSLHRTVPGSGGSKLVRYGSGAVYFPGGKRRTVTCISMPAR